MENRRREHKKKFERPVGTKRPEKTFLILCEGTKTEPNYFRSFHVISAQVEAPAREIARCAPASRSGRSVKKSDVVASIPFAA